MTLKTFRGAPRKAVQSAHRAPLFSFVELRKYSIWASAMKMRGSRRCDKHSDKRKSKASFHAVPSSDSLSACVSSRMLLKM